MNKKTVRAFFAAVMVLLMVGAASFTNEYEIIFPEIGALVAGAWVADKHPWRVNKLQFVLVMSFAAFLGVFLQMLTILPILLKIIIAFLVSGLLLTLCHCTMLPMLSACILPILMGTSSVVYPISVTIMTVLVVIVEYLFERKELRNIHIYKRYIYLPKLEIKRWALLLLVLTIVAVPAVAVTQFNLKFLIAPPLIVTMAEFSYHNSKARKHPVKIWIMLGIGSIIGALCKYLLCITFNLSLTAAAAVIVTLVALMLYISKSLFPPACAVALLPLIITEGADILMYPPEIIIGSALLICGGTAVGKIIRQRHIS